jgi:hypothetical protein|tara:strand:+ start:922 stop:1062 length:141 start_codon:yes stop_codon:yes gene_type:complete
MPAYGEKQIPAGKGRNLEYIIKPTNRGKTSRATAKQMDNKHLKNKR